MESPYAPSVIISVLKYLLCQTLTLAEQQTASASRSQILGLPLCSGLPLAVEAVPRPPVPGGWQGAAARPLASHPAWSTPTARSSETPSCTHSRCLLQRGLLKQILQKVRTDSNTDGKSPVCTKHAGGSRGGERHYAEEGHNVSDFLPFGWLTRKLYCRLRCRSHQSAQQLEIHPFHLYPTRPQASNTK